MKPTTLNEYYTSQGQALPSVSARQGAAAQAGIQNYTGTAAQNTQLLGYLQSSGSQGTPTPVIPAPVAIGTTQPINLPNRPEPQAPTNAANSAMAYLSSIPKTGVAGIDSANQAISQVMQNTIANPELLQKQTKANELKAKADLFNEEYRKKAEAARTNPMLGAETLNSRLGALERERAFTAGTLAIEAAAAQQDFTSMKQLLNEQAQIELEPLKFNRDFFSTMYQKTEDQRFQRAMKAEDRAYQSALEDKKMLNDIKMQAFKDGKIGINDLGTINSWDDLKNLTGETKVDAMQEFSAKNTITTIDDALLNKGGLAGAVGPRAIARREIFRPGKVQTFIATVEQIAGQLTIDKLVQAKNSGATFGALSDSEQRLLAGSASKLGSWAIKDKTGKTTGYKVPETEVIKELQKIKEFAVLDYERKTGKKYIDDPLNLGVAESDPLNLWIQ